MNRVSRIFQPITAVSNPSQLTNKDFISKSQRLMLELGIIHQGIPGCFHILPMGTKSLNKIINIVNEEMHNIGGQNIIFPTLVNSDLWERSGRASDMGPELITLRDRHIHKYILGPTHEETASHLVSSLAPMSYKKFPLLLYQITSKFRDEIKPRFGLIRAREFLMKDLYSFDVSHENALGTYEKVCQSYENIFRRIGVDYIKVVGSAGVMGGNLSHEFHYLSNIGDDKILTCQKCSHATNTEVLSEQKCPHCGETSEVTVQNAIEVAHTFFLGDKYSKPLNANYLDEQSKPHPLQMGSYGIGVSRLLAATLECLSSEQELRWPDSIAPYNVVIIPPKRGSKEEKLLGNAGDDLYQNLESFVPALKENILLDDRTWLTIGRRFLECQRIGIRYIVVLNKRSCESPPVFEVNDIVKNERVYLSESDIVMYIKNGGILLKGTATD